MLMGVDPGGTTGVAVFDEDSVRFTKLLEVKFDEIGRMFDIIGTYKPSVVVIEAFKLYPWRAKTMSWNSMAAAQVIGVVKACCIEQRIPIVEQPASVRKTIAEPAIQRTGLVNLGRGKRHAKDAALHVLWYFAKTYPNRFKQVLQEGVDASALDR